MKNKFVTTATLLAGVLALYWRVSARRRFVGPGGAGRAGMPYSTAS